MSRALLALSLPCALHGCFLVASAMGCDDQPLPRPQDQRCEAILDATESGDSAVIAAIRNRPRSAEPLSSVRLEGRITDGGAPVERAAVRLMLDDAMLAVVRTDAEGRYGLTVLVEESTCEALRLHVSDDGVRAAEPASPGCGETVLHYDFESAAWSDGAQADRPLH